MNMYKFGNYICKLREEKNLTQSELASLLDVTDKSVSKWENGQAFPRIDTFEKLALVLGTSVWVDSRTNGLSKKIQSQQNDRVKLYEDDYGRDYLWLIEDYNVSVFDESGEAKSYEDFAEHYVYVCDSPEETHFEIKKTIDIFFSLIRNGEVKFS